MAGIEKVQVDIAGHDCMVRCNAKGTPVETWEVFIFYTPIREFLIVSCAPTEEQAIKDAEAVLSDRVRFGCMLISTGTRRMEDFLHMERQSKRLNRGVVFGDDLPLVEKV
jgi:hypothetical protein